MSRSLPFVLMRGGTSKGVFLDQADVPADREALTRLVLSIFGSPDRRQIDGLGGADKLTSKVAVIGPPVRAGSDLSYLFGQVGIAAPEVDFRPNCGNLTAAVGMYAIQQALVPAAEGMTQVRIHNLNTDRIIVADVPVRHGEPLVEGHLAIGGVPGTGAPIGLDFSAAAGSATGRLLPLGEPLTVLEVPGYGGVPVSVVDCGNLVVFVAAEDLGMEGTETPAEIDTDPALVARIDAIRRAVAHKVGLGDYWESRAVPGLPFLMAVQSPRGWRRFTDGVAVEAAAVDLVCRQYAAGATSQALAATATACVGVACRIQGSVAQRKLGARAAVGERIVIGHPSGTIAVDARLEPGEHESAPRVAVARIFRTARRLAEGRVYLRGA